MTEQGLVAQASNNDGMGLIHLGGNGTGSWLSFAIGDCTPQIAQRIQQGDIPPNPGFPVTFDVSSDDGNLIAINLR